MRKSLLALGVLFSISLIACSDSKDSPAAAGASCQAGYIYTTDQNILREAYNYNNNAYNYNNNYNYNNQPAVTNQYCVSNSAYNWARQQLGYTNGTTGGTGNVSADVRRYCDQYVNDVMNDPSMDWLDDPYFRDLIPAYRDYYLNYCLSQCSYGQCL